MINDGGILMKPVIIYGFGDFGKQMHYYLTQDAKREVVSFCVDKNYLTEREYMGLPVVAFENVEEFYDPNNFEMLLAIGYNNMSNRENLFKKAKVKGYKLINSIHSSSICDPNLEIGENNIILANVVIEPFVQIGNNNILWSNCLICHDAKIGSHNFIAAKSLVGGFSKITDRCFLGFNSTVIEKLVIAQDSLIAANSLILKNTESANKYKGVPGKKYGSNHQDKGIELL